MDKLKCLKKKAKRLYLKATNFDDMDCGREMAEFIRPEIAEARIEFSRVWQEIQKLDSSAPQDPFLHPSA